DLGRMCGPTCAAAIRSMSGPKIRLRPPPRRAPNPVPDSPIRRCANREVDVVDDMAINTPDLGQSQRLRLNTLVRLRWLAIFGQSAAVIFVAWGLDFPFPTAACFVLIACSAALNVYLSVRYPPAHRLPPGSTFAILTFDALQLAGLLYMT